MSVVTVSRQYGSLGNEIAARVCEVLEYRIFDKGLMAEVASELALAQGEILDFSEETYKLQGFLDRLLGLSNPRTVAKVDTWHETATGARTKMTVELDEEYAINLIRNVIRAAYEHDDVVIVGRGGQAILKDKANVVHVRIVAPYDTRVKNLYERANYSWGGAKEAVLQHDKISAEYLKRFHNIDWDDPLLYDLMINTGKFDVETAAQFIINAVKALST